MGRTLIPRVYLQDSEEVMEWRTGKMKNGTVKNVRMCGGEELVKGFLLMKHFHDWTASGSVHGAEEGNTEYSTLPTLTFL